MHHANDFLTALTTAQRLIASRRQEKPTSDYWRLIEIILDDAHYIQMVTAEMRDDAVTWQTAVRRMTTKNCRKLRTLRTLRTPMLDDFEIELQGACKFLLDHCA